MDLARRLKDKIIFIIGNNKNAGKTTFLNYALEQLRQTVVPAFLTIGIDGEKKDLIFDNPKPQIYTQKGDYIITTDQMLNNSDGLFEIHQVFPETSVLGRIVLARTIRAGYIELVGSENNRQLSDIIEYLKQEKKLKTILIDGAVNRITQVSSALNAGYIYVIKINKNNINSSIETIKTIALIKTFPVIDRDKMPDNFFEIKGALTNNKLQQIPDDCKNLIINDFTKIFLNYRDIKKLSQQLNIFYNYNYKFYFFLLNIYDIEKNEIKKLLGKNKIKEDIIFNPYQID